MNMTQPVNPPQTSYLIRVHTQAGHTPHLLLKVWSMTAFREVVLELAGGSFKPGAIDEFTVDLPCLGAPTASSNEGTVTCRTPDLKWRCSRIDIKEVNSDVVWSFDFADSYPCADLPTPDMRPIRSTTFPPVDAIHARFIRTVSQGGPPASLTPDSSEVGPSTPPSSS
jgi:hypothetical protein